MAMDSSSITDLTLSKENESAVLKFTSMENRTTELRLIVGHDPHELKVIVTQNTLSELNSTEVNVDQENPKTTPTTNTSGAYDMGDMDLELRKIMNVNFWCCAGCIMMLVILMITVDVAGSGRLSDDVILAWIRMCIWGYVILGFDAAGLLILVCGLLPQPGRERDRRGAERVQRWCKNKLVTTYLMLHLITHFRIRNLLPRINQHQFLFKEEAPTVTHQEYAQ